MNWNVARGGLLCASALALVLVGRSYFGDESRHAGGEDNEHAIPGSVQVTAVPFVETVATPDGRTEIRGSGAVSQLVPGPAELPALLVRVLDPQDTPVAGAEVGLEANGVRVGNVRTGATGECRIDRNREDSLILVVRAKGLEALRHPVHHERTEEVVVRMRRDAVIRGRVVWSDGTKLGTGVRILAWPEGYEPKSAAVLRVAREKASLGPRLLVATTDGDGQFAVEGLARGKRYAVTAAVPGGVCLERPISYPDTSDAASMELIVQPVYGAIIHLRQNGGGTPESGPSVHAAGPIWFSGDEAAEGEFFPLPRKMAELPLLHVSASELPLSTGFDQVLLLGSKTHRVQSVSIVYEVELPGYEPVRTEFTAEPLDENIPEYVVSLRPVAFGWGSLEIGCSGFSLGIVPDSLTNERLGVLHLIAEDGSRLGIVLKKPCSGLQRVEGIPYGLYQAFFTMQDWAVNYPPNDARLSLTIGPETALLDLPFENVGAVLLTTHESNGSEYTGELVIRLFSDGGWSNKYLSFRRAPYVMENLPAGEFSIAIERVPGLEAGKQDRCSFEVREGEISTPTLNLIR